MGTIAARDCIRVLELTEQVAAAELLAVYQALEIRLRSEEIDLEVLSPEIAGMREQVFSKFEFLTEDRPLEGDLREMVSLIQGREWALYSAK
jgi:histidine ammonia-lyase